MNAVARQPEVPGTTSLATGQPNEFDRRRIERSLQWRDRYRYVTPTVHAMTDGYRIASPCCSRNIDPDGGVVDIALLLYTPGDQPWRLYRRDHELRQWFLHSSARRLDNLLALLLADPRRLFWQ